jgi:hypothetical protein
MMKGKTIHKDWDGPGWYHRWAHDGKYIGDWQYGLIDFCEQNTYQKFEPPKPPKPPKEELKDGFYFVDRGDYGLHIIEIKYGEPIRCKINDGDKVLGRIPIEPVND